MPKSKKAKPKAASAHKAASAPTCWPIAPDEMKAKHGDLSMAAYSYKPGQPFQGNRDNVVAASNAANSSMPASSSSSTDPPSAEAQSIPKRLQNRPMSKMATKQ